MIRKNMMCLVILVSVLVGCGKSVAESEPLAYSANEADVSDVSEEPEAVMPVFADNDPVTEEPVQDDLIEEYYYSDGSVYIRMNLTSKESAIYDGDEVIPIDIATGLYGARIEKYDADGDGADEYIIAECENTGTGISTYGLCIVEKDGDEYVLNRYDGKYFTEVIEERISCDYDLDSHILTVTAHNNGKTVDYTIAQDSESELEYVCWGDIIRIRLIDGKIFLSAPTGCFFKDSWEPDYSRAVEVMAQITVKPDSCIVIGDFTLGEDDGIKTP